MLMVTRSLIDSSFRTRSFSFGTAVAASVIHRMRGRASSRYYAGHHAQLQSSAVISTITEGNGGMTKPPSCAAGRKLGLAPSRRTLSLTLQKPHDFLPRLARSSACTNGLRDWSDVKMTNPYESELGLTEHLGLGTKPGDDRLDRFVGLALPGQQMVAVPREGRTKRLHQLARGKLIPDQRQAD